MFLRKNWLPLLLFVMMICAVSLYILTTQAHKEPIKTHKPVEVENPATPKPPPPGETAENGHWHGDEWHAEPHSETTEVSVGEAEPHTPQNTSEDTAEVQGTSVGAQPKTAPIIKQAVRNGNVTLFYARTQEYHNAVKKWQDWHKKFDELFALEMQAGDMLIDALPTIEEAKQHENDKAYRREMDRKVRETLDKSSEMAGMIRAHEAKKPPFPYIR